MDGDELEVLLSLNGASWEAGDGYVVEFTVHRTRKTPERPHGITYALVLRAIGGKAYLRFDNAHAAQRSGGRFVKAPKEHDHWHRSKDDPGRPYVFTTPMQLLDDFWREVRRILNERRSR